MEHVDDKIINFSGCAFINEKLDLATWLLERRRCFPIRVLSICCIGSKGSLWAQI